MEWDHVRDEHISTYHFDICQTDFRKREFGILPQAATM